MSGLLDSLMSTLGPQVLQQMAGKLGASPQQTETGLAGAQSQDLLAMLAPLVMGALGKQGAGGGADLDAMLGGATQQMQQQGGGLGSKVMTAVLDRDGDGDVDFADLMAMAQGGGAQPQSGAAGGLGGLLGGLLGGRR